VTVAINIASLLVVIALCVVAVNWVSGWVHSRRRDDPDAELSHLDWTAGAESPCRECNGSGALTRLGRIQPCPVCEGTGIQQTVF